MKIIKNFIILIVSLLLSHFLAVYVGTLYNNLFPNVIGTGGIFMVPKEFGYYVIGIIISYIFFLTLLFTAFGGKHKYWWIGILLIPAAVVEFYFDLSHIYVPILLALAGFLLGHLISRFFEK